MNRKRLVALYSVFAILSIVVNIATQALSVWIYDGRLSIAVSILAGTATGLVAKYVLDKRFIFRYETVSAAHETKTFVLYTAMGIFTTLVFWGSEAVFHYFFLDDAMRYLGGVIGLCVGYVIKYSLDARFVFTQAKSAQRGTAPPRSSETH